MTQPPNGRYVACCFHCREWGRFYLSEEENYCLKYMWFAGPGYICDDYKRDIPEVMQ